MKQIGLNKALVESLINASSWGGFGYNCSVFLFKGPEASSFDDLDLVMSTAGESNHFRALCNQADAVMNCSLSVDEVSGKVRLSLVRPTTDLMMSSFEQFHKGKADRSVYDVLTASTQVLGDCVIYKPNNFASATETTTVAIPNILTKADKFADFNKAMIREALTERELFGYGSGVAANIGRRHYSNLAYAGSAATIFDEPVEADFIYFHMVADGNVIVNRNVNFQLVAVDNSLITLPTFTALVNTVHKYTFAKQMIKGIRVQSPKVSIEANHYCTYLANSLTAGLSDYSGNASVNNPQRSEWTHAVVVPLINATDRALAHRAPMMLMSVGDSINVGELTLTSLTDSWFDKANLPASQVILQLDV